MRFNHSKKIIVLLAVILSIALHANIRHLKEEVTIYRSGNTHEISLLEKRLSTLKKELPPDGKIGLITDERSKYFPYVLAPLIIVDYRKLILMLYYVCIGNIKRY